MGVMIGIDYDKWIKETSTLSPISCILIIFLSTYDIRESIRRNAIEAILSYATTEPEPLSLQIPESIETAQLSFSNSSSQGE